MEGENKTQQRAKPAAKEDSLEAKDKTANKATEPRPDTAKGDKLILRRTSTFVKKKSGNTTDVTSRSRKTTEKPLNPPKGLNPTAAEDTLRKQPKELHTLGEETTENIASCSYSTVHPVSAKQPTHIKKKYASEKRPDTKSIAKKSVTAKIPISTKTVLKADVHPAPATTLLVGTCGQGDTAKNISNEHSSLFTDDLATFSDATVATIHDQKKITNTTDATSHDQKKINVPKEMRHIVNKYQNLEFNTETFANVDDGEIEIIQYSETQHKVDTTTKPIQDLAGEQDRNVLIENSEKILDNADNVLKTVDERCKNKKKVVHDKIKPSNVVKRKNTTANDSFRIIEFQPENPTSTATAIQMKNLFNFNEETAINKMDVLKNLFNVKRIGRLTIDDDLPQFQDKSQTEFYKENVTVQASSGLSEWLEENYPLSDIPDVELETPKAQDLSIPKGLMTNAYKVWEACKDAVAYLVGPDNEGSVAEGAKPYSQSLIVAPAIKSPLRPRKVGKRTAQARGKGKPKEKEAKGGITKGTQASRKKKGRRRGRKRKGKKGARRKGKSKKKQEVLEQEQFDLNFIQRSGFFEDGKRRADYVIVVSRRKGNKATEGIKTEFLTNAIKLGLHLEVEAGVSPHSYQFIKVHGPDAFFHSYADLLGIENYEFRENHMQLINDDKERNLLMAIRKGYQSPLFLSPLERSYVVYTILQHIDFGIALNYYGLQRLIDTNVLVDGFALHDGPCDNKAFKPITRRHLNARQILYTEWAGVTNILTPQPFHIIYEYYGAKIAYYFVLYDLYNKMLLVSSVWGLFIMILYWLKDSEYMSSVRKYACNECNIHDVFTVLLDKRTWQLKRPEHMQRLFQSSVICAECEGEADKNLCPYYTARELCTDLHLMRYVDSPYIFLYSAGIIGFMFMFLRAWRRAETFYALMWSEKPCHQPERYEYEVPLFDPEDLSLNPEPSLKDRVMVKVKEVVYSSVGGVCLPIAVGMVPLITIIFLFIVPYPFWRKATLTEVQKTNVRPPEVNVQHNPNIVPMLVDRRTELWILFLLGVAAQIVLLIIEKAFHIIILRLTKSENHSRQSLYNLLLCQRLFIASLLLMSTTTIYFGWLKGTFHFSPVAFYDEKFILFNTEYTFPLPRRLINWNCGPFSCFRQGSLMYLAAILVLSAQKIFATLSCVARSMNPMDFPARVPYWEREYRLENVTEDRMMADYNSMLLQMSMVILFAPFFPLAPLLPLLINVIHLRVKATHYVIHCRRPVLRKAGDLRPWSNVLTAIVCALPIIHGITLTRTEVFKKWAFYSAFNRPWVRTGWSKVAPVAKSWALRHNWTVDRLFNSFLFHANFFFTEVQNREFLSLNRKRIYNETHGRTPLLNTPLALFFHVKIAKLRRILSYYEPLVGCRADGMYSYMHKEGPVAPWPYAQSVMYDFRNASRNVPEPEHYLVLYYKALFFIYFCLFFLLLGLCLKLYSTWDELHEIRRRRITERVIKDMRLVQLHMLQTEPEEKIAEQVVHIENIVKVNLT